MINPQCVWIGYLPLKTNRYPNKNLSIIDKHKVSTLDGVMISALDKQLFTSEFKSH